jgi:hypothetical protein
MRVAIVRHCGAGDPRQGYPWTHDPHRSATCYHQGSGQLGAGGDRSHFTARLLVMTMFDNRLANKPSRGANVSEHFGFTIDV